AETANAHEGDGSEGGGRRRRRRGRGGDRGDRPERGDRNAAREANAADAVASAPVEPAGPLAHVVDEPAHVPEGPVAAPPPPLAPLAEPIAFHDVSEHQDSEAHRPVRRRHRETPAGAEQAPLLLVETQAPAVETAPMEDEQPRRTKPRRRRGAQADSGPL